MQPDQQLGFVDFGWIILHRLTRDLPEVCRLLGQIIVYFVVHIGVESGFLK